MGMQAGQRLERWAEMRSHIGRRCHWQGETTGGTITGLSVRARGWPAYHIRWDEECPDWWADVISPTSQLVIDCVEVT